MLVKTQQGNKDVQITEVTPENYIVPKGEEHLFHAVIEVKKFDANTGKRQSIPRIQKFGKKSFESGGVRDNLKRQGYDIITLHDPNEWLENSQKVSQEQKAENERIALEQKKQREEQLRIQKEKDDQKRIDDAVAKALGLQSANQQKAIDDAVAKALATQKPKTTAPTPTGDSAKTDAAKAGDTAKTTGTSNPK